jgi:saccharopine dehydrogenase-like NADP-dependent oxidoreductase
MALLGLASDSPLEVKGARVAPRDFTLALLKREKLLGIPPNVVPNDWEVMDIEMSGTAGGRPETRHVVARFPPYPEWGLSATEYAVGVCGAIGAELILAGSVLGKGVLPPESCIPAGPFREALKARGIVTSITPPESPLPPLDPRSKRGASG